MAGTDAFAADKMRLLIADLDKDNQLFTDQQLEDFTDLYGGNVKLGAARALRTIAASEVLLSKKITSQDLSTDGPAVSAELRALADSLEAEAQSEDYAVNGAFADYVEPAYGYGSRSEGEEYRASDWF